MQKHFRVTYDSSNDNQFTVHNEHMRNFKMSARGLYFCDMKQEQGNVLLNDATATGGILTVEKNKARYTARDIERANRARKFQEITGTSLETLLGVIDRKLLLNLPITRADVKAAEDIYGTSLAHLKGKTMRRQGEHVLLRSQFYQVPLRTNTASSLYAATSSMSTAFASLPPSLGTSIFGPLNTSTMPSWKPSSPPSNLFKGYTWHEASKSMSSIWMDNLNHFISG